MTRKKEGKSTQEAERSRRQNDRKEWIGRKQEEIELRRT